MCVRVSASVCAYMCVHTACMYMCLYLCVHINTSIDLDANFRTSGQKQLQAFIESQHRMFRQAVQKCAQG